MDEDISDRRFKGITVQGLTTNYREVRMMTHRYSKMGLEETQSTTMQSMYLDDMLYRNANRRGIAGRGAAMAVESARYNLLQLHGEGALQERLPCTCQ